MNFKNTRSGFTITELLVATGLVSAFFLLGASVVQQLFTFQNDVNNRLMDNFSVVNFHRAMNADLSGSYWHRYGAFSCPTANKVLDTNSTATATLSSSGGMFEFVTTDFSSTVGNVPKTERLAVATMRNLSEGDYVLLSSSAEPAKSGLFKIKTLNQANSQITVETTTLDIAGTSCTYALSAKSISDFFASSSNTILSRVKVVQYSIVDGELLRAVLPGSTQGEKILKDMNSVTFKSTWKTSSEGDTAKQYGQMKFEVTLDNNQSTLMGSKAKSRQVQNVVAQFNLDSFQYANRNFASGSTPITAIFPSCSVGYNFRPGALTIAPGADGYADTVPISLTGYVSTDKVKGATIDVSFVKGADAVIHCFKHDPDSGVYPTTGALSAPGIQSSLSLMQPSTFDVYTCAVKGTVEVTASMTYFSSDVSAVKTIPCSAESIVAPTKYRFSGGKPSCDKTWAKWNMGGEIVSALPDKTTVSLGRFGVDSETSCQWEGQANSKNSGIADNCDWGSHAGLDLKRIYLRPYKQQVYSNDYSTPLFDSQGAYIDCD